MDETPPTAALDARRRRLLFRATHRGTRENDLLIGGLSVSARVAIFTDAEIDAVEEILELPDPAVSDWLTGRAPLPEGAPMLHAMRQAALSHRKDVLF